MNIGNCCKFIEISQYLIAGIMCMCHLIRNLRMNTSINVYGSFKSLAAPYWCAIRIKVLTIFIWYASFHCMKRRLLNKKGRFHYIFCLWYVYSCSRDKTISHLRCWVLLLRMTYKNYKQQTNKAAMRLANNNCLWEKTRVCTMVKARCI